VREEVAACHSWRNISISLIDTRSVNSPTSILLRWWEGRGVPHDVTAGELHHLQESKGGPGGRLRSDDVRANVAYFG
jgi:hypothetical protein